jgi:uncharacterized protein involved in exopolysaccharide biosynthesis
MARKNEDRNILENALDAVDLALDVEQLRQLEGIRRLIRQEGNRIMATLEGINSALADLSGQITQLADQVAALSADTVTQEQLDAIEANIRDAAAAVDAIVEPDPGEAPEEPAP